MSERLVDKTAWGATSGLRQPPTLKLIHKFSGQQTGHICAWINLRGGARVGDAKQRFSSYSTRAMLYVCRFLHYDELFTRPEL